MVTPFQAKVNFLTLRFFYPAALGAQKTLGQRPFRLAMSMSKGSIRKALPKAGTIGTRLGWSNQFPALILGLLESCR
jgi:hypothetical protein